MSFYCGWLTMVNQPFALRSLGSCNNFWICMPSSLIVYITVSILNLFHGVLLLVRDTWVIWSPKVVIFAWSHWNPVSIWGSDSTNHYSKICSRTRSLRSKIVLGRNTIEYPHISTSNGLLAHQLLFRSCSTQILVLSICNNLFVYLMSCGGF